MQYRIIRNFPMGVRVEKSEAPGLPWTYVGWRVNQQEARMLMKEEQRRDRLRAGLSWE